MFRWVCDFAWWLACELLLCTPGLACCDWAGWCPVEEGPLRAGVPLVSSGPMSRWGLWGIQSLPRHVAWQRRLCGRSQVTHGLSLSFPLPNPSAEVGWRLASSLQGSPPVQKGGRWMGLQGDSPQPRPGSRDGDCRLPVPWGRDRGRRRRAGVGESHTWPILLAARGSGWLSPRDC